MLPTLSKTTRLLAALAAAATLTLLAGCGDDGGDTAEDTSGEGAAASPSREATDVKCTYTDDGSEPAKPVDLPPEMATVGGELAATIETSAGTFNATLDADTTPCTVNSFVSLADQGYFDGTTCHRMVTAGIFVLQCGDPSATGAGGPGYSFDDELSGTETYGPGTLAMANAGPNTNGSQFFIVFDDSPLPPSYTVFGSVDEETVATVEEVAADGTDGANGPDDGAPNTPVDIESVTVG
jgi:peptidyl-prolyl cis-trans isomerase B (cyclophilin B)